MKLDDMENEFIQWYLDTHKHLKIDSLKERSDSDINRLRDEFEFDKKLKNYNSMKYIESLIYARLESFKNNDIIDARIDSKIKELRDKFLELIIFLICASLISLFLKNIVWRI